MFIWKIKKKPLQYPQISDRLSVIVMDCHVISQLHFIHCYCFQLMWTYSFRLGQSRVITMFNGTTNRNSVFQIKLYYINIQLRLFLDYTCWRFIKNKRGIYKCFLLIPLLWFFLRFWFLVIRYYPKEQLVICIKTN